MITLNGVLLPDVVKDSDVQVKEELYFVRNGSNVKV